MLIVKVAELMGRHKLTKKALSDITGIRPNTVSLLWQGTIKRLDMDHLDKLCAALNCQPGELLEFIPNKEHMYTPYEETLDYEKPMNIRVKFKNISDNEKQK